MKKHFKGTINIYLRAHIAILLVEAILNYFLKSLTEMSLGEQNFLSVCAQQSRV